jgi:uncharacterized protein (DUF924 family)
MGTAEDVLQFWFGPLPGERRKAWFVKDPHFDEQIRERFLPLYETAAAGALSSWTGSAQGSLALIVVTDQFPRNMFRGSPRAFATDPIALATAKHVIEAGWDARMLPVERMFAYLPYEHSESLADQDRSVELFGPLNVFPETSDALEYSERHRVIVKRFGRFPHRNAALGRASTAEEVEFLKQPGSGF